MLVICDSNVFKPGTSGEVDKQVFPDKEKGLTPQARYAQGQCVRNTKTFIGIVKITSVGEASLVSTPDSMASTLRGMHFRRIYFIGLLDCRERGREPLTDPSRKESKRFELCVLGPGSKTGQP